MGWTLLIILTMAVSIVLGWWQYHRTMETADAIVDEATERARESDSNANEATPHDR
jgi:cytochrome oxidase assembly protein ShyY1